jgi:multisubunit Na+/H+ antiporter MnhG subunit
MRRFETILALVAVVLASLSALQIPGRLILALTAMLLLCIVGSSRLRAMIRDRENKNKSKKGFDAYERAQRIKEERSKRLDR